MKKRNVGLTGILLLTAVCVASFQNCSGMMGAGSFDTGTSQATATSPQVSHPSPTPNPAPAPAPLPAPAPAPAPAPPPAPAPAPAPQPPPAPASLPIYGFWDVSNAYYFETQNPNTPLQYIQMTGQGIVVLYLFATPPANPIAIYDCRIPGSPTGVGAVTANAFPNGCPGTMVNAGVLGYISTTQMANTIPVYQSPVTVTAQRSYSELLVDSTQYVCRAAGPCNQIGWTPAH